MLVFRYFGYVGGALLALLFVCDAVLPKQPPLPSVLKSGPDLPAIRIQSERKWPERVVFDTTVVPIAAPAPASSPVAVAKADTAPVVAPQAQAATVTAKARVHEAFAQFTPAPAVKPQPKHKIAKARATHPMVPGRPVMLAAQQPRYGFFDHTW